ncbi:MAG TPA: methionine--tRNA ligase [Planctomycetaceae bacterium]|nr:methionine--tRNA ligase [Planctomycetaceae bacterium]
MFRRNPLADTTRKILVTAALPYANGHIHIGHLVEYLQTDIWVRFQKLRGHRCIFICADDTHGAAIMLRARKEGRSERELIAEMKAAHVRDFAAFGIEFDNYGSTDSEENLALCHEMWNKIRDAGLVKEKEIEQLYDPEAKLFLADRFVKGTCPYCKLPNQHGDTCDNGHTYAPTELIDPVSTVSGATPEIRKSTHLFIELEQLHGFLEEWTQSGKHLQPEIANYLKGHFLKEELRDWDISRPGPYFGFEIPDSPGNYWYVWFDAPIGYMASTQEWCEREREVFAAWWGGNSDAEIHHFIGKDITYFHTLFWPAMLKVAGCNLPSKIHIHGFLNVDGEKMSKSKGTFVMASTYLNHLDPSYLRYYFASKLGPRVDDIDLNLEDFENKVNADLVGKVVNIASRCAKFISGNTFSETYPDDGGLFAQGAEAGERIAEAFENCDYNSAMREVMVLADRANLYIEENAPWKLKKDPDKTDDLRDVCTVGLNLFRQIVVYLTPVLPELTKKTNELLGVPIANWSDSQTPLTAAPVGTFQHMMQRIDTQKVHAMIEESQEAQATDETPSAAQWNDGPEALAAEPLAEECTIDDFVKVDLRVARVIAANHVPEANKLLQLTLSLGGGVTKNVFAGIKKAYEPEALVGRLVVCVANLKPRQMKFGLSEGMVCASGPGGSDVFLLSPDEGAVPGQRVH